MIPTIIKERDVINPWVDELAMPDILKRVYARRKIEDKKDLDNSLAQLADYSQLSNINEAVQLIYQAIIEQKQILVVGDFDADGATSTAVLLRALHMLGHSKVDYLVPNRFDFGYGLSPELVEVAAEMNGMQAGSLIITVDNGISSITGVAAARKAGFDVLVTDHHLPGDVLPEANAIVNPNLKGDKFLSKSIAGVGVAFYIILALRAYMREQDYFANREVPNFATLLDLVALGTVADVVSLDHTNRILVEQGLRRIRQGQACAGIVALLAVSKKNMHSLVTTDLGFALAPRLNASGRLEDISVGIECLLTDDASHANSLAATLDQINIERREIQQTMSDEAMLIVEKLQQDLKGKELPSVIVLYHPDWHQGVVGIVASKIKSLLKKPIIVMAKVNDDELKGSCRSIQGVNIRDVLEQVDKTDNTLINKYGGHAMAAGLSLHPDQLEGLKAGLGQAMDDLGLSDINDNELYTDGALPGKDITLENAQSLRLAGPWGQSFPEPVFEGQFILKKWRILKDAHLKMELLSENNQYLDAIAFNTVPDWLDELNGQEIKISLVYRLDVNEFRGTSSVQLLVENINRI